MLGLIAAVAPPTALYLATSALLLGLLEPPDKTSVASEKGVASIREGYVDDYGIDRPGPLVLD